MQLDHLSHRQVTTRQSDERDGGGGAIARHLAYGGAHREGGRGSPLRRRGGEDPAERFPVGTRAGR
jgi:hypothetical protein